jgi:hypothetical protein
MDEFLQQYRGRGSSFTHSVTARAGEHPVKLSVPAEDLSKFYEALAKENSPPAVMEKMGKSTAYSIDLKVASVQGDTLDEILDGKGENPGLLGFAQYAAANVAEVYGAAQPFLVYAGMYYDDRTTLQTVIMRAHFPGVLVNADRHKKLTKKIQESVEYRTLQHQALVTQVVSLGEYLHRCSHDQNSWPTALREQLNQEKKEEFRMVFADHAVPKAPDFDKCVMKPFAIFNSSTERVGDGSLPDVSPEDQPTTHLKMATKRPMDCEDTKQEHLNSVTLEKTSDGEYVTKWVQEPQIKKSDNRTGYGGSVDTEPGAKPRARNFAPDKRSNLDVDLFRKNWIQLTNDKNMTTDDSTDGVIKYVISINEQPAATVTLDLKGRSATLVQTQPNPGVEAAFRSAATAGGVRK